MKKWIRRVLYLVAFGLIGAIVAAFVFNWMSMATPEWYRPQRLSAAQIEDAANRMDQKLLALMDRVSGLRAGEGRGAVTGPATRATTRPGDGVELQMTSDELNAFFQKWAKLNRWDQKVGRYVADPQVHLKDGQLILAAKVVGVEALNGRVVHIHFRPELDQKGRLNVNLLGVWSGSLPLPSALWNSQKDRLVNLVTEQLPRLGRKAKIGPRGEANGEAVAAGMGQLAVDMLEDRPADPVLFVPVPGGEGGVPVELTGLKVEDQTLKLTARPLTAGQRAALLERLKGLGATPVAGAVR